MPRKIVSKSFKSESFVTPIVNEGNFLIKKSNRFIEILKARHQRHYRDNSFHLWADVLLASTLFGLVVIVFLLVFWQPKAEFSLAGSFASSRILSGQSENFTIAYQNGEDGFISGTSLKLVLPDNFILESVEPKGFFDAESNTFNLGDLNKNYRGEIQLKGIVRGEVGDRQAIGLNLTYQFGQVRKQLLDSVVYFVDGSAMELNLEVPSETYKDVSFDGSVEIKNTSQAKLDSLAIAFPSTDWQVSPDDMTLENGRVAIPTLDPGASTKITFSAINNQGNNSQFIVQGLFLIGDKTLKQVEISKNISISEPSLYLSSNFTSKALLGDTANASLSYTNNSQSDISNLTLAFESKRNTLSVVNVTTNSNSFSSVNNTLNHNGSITAGDRKVFDAMIKLQHNGTSLNDFVNLNIVVSYTMDNKSFKYSVPMPKLKINSNISVSSAGYYYGPQGDQLGIGPLPPKVDIPTTYWVIWEANNLGNDLSDFEVSADLPINVVWLDQKSVVAGDVTYSPVSRRILWRADKIAQTGGNYRVSFAISLVPRSQDLGTEPILLSNIKFSAKDLYTDDIISKNLANITTNIEQDRKATGKGKVEPLE
ncbi:MAG: hypothetical protein NTY12_03240 [Candidatus Falkowbacteria bacterium]|nr:hypothetical protein [Candidatus Falkowbacteria bacterium]